jgi:peptidyl-prolyl cis-trans isomerase A (cyclophilin A)
MSSRRSFLVLAIGCALAGTSALAQTPQASAAAQAAAPVRVELKTGEGPIVLELYPDKAPITVANFLRYVDRRLYDGASFYRASRPVGSDSSDYGLVQGGLHDDGTRKLKPIAHESTLKTGLSHTDGTISMGRFAPGTATSEFFIAVGDQTYLDANPKAPGDNLGFAAFGRVVEGMDVVRKILVMPLDANAGGAAMRGEILKRPVPILTARRMGSGAP